MRSKYSNGNIFNEVVYNRFPRHKFNLGHFNKLTCNHGLAIPFLTDIVSPGDRVDCNTFGRIQLQPLATSSMQNIKCYFRYFYVPFRLLWDEWDDFMTQEINGDTNFDNPYVVLDGSLLNMLREPGCLADYLGLGLYNEDENGNVIEYSPDAKLPVNLWMFQAYRLIWDYYFRDENLQNELTVELSRGNNRYFEKMYFYQLLPVAYEKDYFTSALPWPQKGDPVNLSAFVSQSVLDGTVTIDKDGVRVIPYSSDRALQMYADKIGVANGTANLVSHSNDGIDTTNPSAISFYSAHSEEAGHTTVDIPENTLTTSLNINDLRYSNALQRFLERKALGGSRPSEFYLSMYGVRVDDLRIGQPLYLGGGSVNVSVTDVASTVDAKSTDGTPLPQGTLAGNGKAFPAISMNHPYYCQEFGVIMGIMYIRPEINYSQGLPRHFTTMQPLDYFNPLFSNLGEEAVYKSELVVKPDINRTVLGNNDDIFGYQSRYAYLKHKRNEIHGDFKDTLSSWVLSAHFQPDVELNSDFIVVDQNYDIFAVEDAHYHHYLVELYNDYQKESSMSNHVIPSL